MTIRDGTKYEEVIGVRREWVYPWRFDLASAYYDIAVMELGKRPVLLFHHIHFIKGLLSQETSNQQIRFDMTRIEF